jgi:bifunctional non-homologous end joining protein LigD
MSTRIVNTYPVEITNQTKIWFPQTSITKLDIIQYYDHIAPHMLSFMKNRPLTMQRYPDGITGKSFYQKDAFSYFPDWIQTENIEKKNGDITHYVVCQNKATLLYLANFGCITLHLWLSQISNLENPDRLIFDLDPSTHNFDLVKQTARILKQLLELVGLTPFLMTTGSRGLHVIVPLDKKLDYVSVKNFADKCAQLLVHENPLYLTQELRKNKRGKKVFIDTLRNQYGATAVAPYSIRAYSDAPIATPLAWHELDNPRLSSQSFTIHNIFKRLDSIANPWENFKKPQSLKRAIRALDKLIQHR